ncbi:MAG: ytcQ 2 [Paenibacillaceae bacterium]|jgi:putative aldouronate transport system substrate-binding protein|nr:ytcQ 2 [Paenibacillaceae bacterium]
MSIRRNLSVLLVAALTLVLVLSACSGNGKEAGNDSQQSAKEPAAANAAPVKFKVMLPYWGDMPDDNSPFFKELQTIMNAEITPVFTQGGNSYFDKVNVLLSSGDLPDAIDIPMQNQPYTINAIRAGAFWEVDPYLKDFPNLLAGRDPDRDNNVKVDGKTYGVYIPQSRARQGIDMRQDWLDNLGLKQPQTIDELYQVLKAFTVGDPDKNGKNDTIGLMERLGGNYPQGFNQISLKYGAPNNYAMQNGQFIPAFTTEAYRNAMKFYKRLYYEGIMNKDFAYIKVNQADELIQTGKAGATMGNADNTTTWIPLFENNSKAKLLVFSTLNGPTGNHIAASRGYFNVLLFPRQTVKTEQRLKEILGALDRLAAPDKKDFRQFGVKGVHYNDENGKKTVLQPLENQYLILMETLAPAPYEMPITPGTPDYLLQMKKVVVESDKSKDLVSDPTYPLLSETYVKMGKELDKIISDAVIKYIIGEIDDKGFDSAIAKWKSSGGDKVIQEYAAAYQKSK